ncbi:ATP-grasp domain-containing protein [Actinophytocola algeriensis]|uniref:Carbamoylphosphate synthase large subunit n=1 Tax=Actinophytocola algeriensis TaxID=1768010 RepID=A0A7W7VCJ0_9PSEU|nr:ATP-grasp domain-containing protein [Actinophytocola algeriensis]MBB4905146.1 carbamoylphosphate synthase large subunit [Actinophytocola algeriensis]MBE1473169.1 carbamoylphosphate synthase large subunit [Actinophytocola algeriensis]
MRVLVTGVGGPAGDSVLRQLRHRGIETVGADLVPSGPQVEPVPPGHAPGFPAALTELARRHLVDLAIPTVSEELVPLAALGDPRIVVGPAEAVAIADDKWLTFLLLREVGVAVPWSCLAGDPVPGGTPLLSKPRVGRGGRGVVLHEDDVPARDRGRIVQELLSDEEYVVNLYLTDDPGRDVVDVLEKDVRCVRPAHAPDVAALAWSAAAAIGLRGPVDVDVRRGSDGRPAVLDVNARFGAHSARTPAVLDALLAEHRC